MPPLKLNADAYQSIGASEQIIDWLSHGIKIPFYAEPGCLYGDNYVYFIQHQAFVDKEIGALLRDGTIKQVDYVPKCIHPMRCVPKKKNKLRLVID